VRKLLERYRVTDGRRFRLSDYDPADAGDVAERKALAPARAKLMREG
jgi:hypothetical protein